jgi:hypothetical protein
VRLLRSNMSIWKRFVDDIFTILPNGSWQDTLRMLNSINKNIQFTMEMESEGRLPFLDLEITRGDNKLDTKVYRKGTHSGTYLHYTSEHAHSHKMSVCDSLAYRALTYCSKEDDKKIELQLITKELMDNGYPKLKIQRSFEKTKSNLEVEGDGESTTEQKTISIPYVEHLSYAIKRILDKHDIRTIMIPGINLRNIVCKLKDRITTEETANCIYVIGCKDCDATYVGETKRRFKNRLTEHKAAVRNANSKDSALAEHAIEKLHTPNWETPKIVSKDRDFRTRRFKEAVAIINQKNPLNRNEGMKISETFKPLITNFKDYNVNDNENKFRAKTKSVRFLPNW